MTGARVTINDEDAGLWMYMAMSAVPAESTVLVTVQVNDRPGYIAEATEEKAL